jgi:adenylate kinase
MIYLLSGISGVGKSTVLKNSDAEFTHVNFGSKVLEVAQREGLAKHRDDLKKLSPETVQKIQHLVVEDLKKMPGTVVVDTHLTIESPYGFFPGIPEWMARELKFKALIIVEAPPKEIQKRRNKDAGKRKREKSSLEDIKLQLDLDRASAIALSLMIGAPVKIIENVELDKAAGEMTELLK